MTRLHGVRRERLVERRLVGDESLQLAFEGAYGKVLERLCEHSESPVLAGAEGESRQRTLGGEVDRRARWHHAATPGDQRGERADVIRLLGAQRSDDGSIGSRNEAQRAQCARVKLRLEVGDQEREPERIDHIGGAAGSGGCTGVNRSQEGHAVSLPAGGPARTSRASSGSRACRRDWIATPRRPSPDDRPRRSDWARTRSSWG